MRHNPSTLGVVTPLWANIKKEEFIEFAVMAEELGYDSIWVPEMWGRDAFSIMTLLSIHTLKIGIASGVVSVFSRTPAAIASAIATIDEISGGRVILGLGTSGPAVIENWHGVKFEQPIERTKEYVQIIRLILSGSKANYVGNIFKLKDFRLMFEPIRKDIPIFIASLGPKNVRMTAEIANGWIPYLVPIESIRKIVESELPNSLRLAGSTESDFKIAPYFPTCVSENPEESKRVVRDLIAYYVGGMGTYYASALSRYGFEEEVKTIRDAWASGNKSKAVSGVTSNLLNAVAIAGTRAEALEKLEEIMSLGAVLPILFFPPRATRKMVWDTMTALAPSRNND